MRTSRPGRPAGIPSGRPAKALLAEARHLLAQIDHALGAVDAARRPAEVTLAELRTAAAEERLAAMPIATLKDVTEGRLNLSPLEQAGYRTVASVVDVPPLRLQQLPGVGPQTATRVVAAARHLHETVAASTPVRFDPDAKPALHTTLLGELLAYHNAKRSLDPTKDALTRLRTALDTSVTAATPASSRLRMLFSGGSRKATVATALHHVASLVQDAQASGRASQLDVILRQLSQPPPPPHELWQRYAADPVTFNGLLIEIGGAHHDEEAAEGHLPDDVAERVRAQPLDTSLMGASLRGYQAFGAKFALAQRRSIIGDEMGLGKTLEALGAICHLHATGSTHSLVVCPASVLVNWAHEIERHTSLRSHRLHGADLRRQHASWVADGGVALTTYGTLGNLPTGAAAAPAMMVVDEAHYVKNPAANRTKAVSGWIARTERTLFLTGTPMENRVDEFKVLVGHLQPEVAARVSASDGVAGATAFRRVVAPAYLRRNQDDVLDELPPRIETEEWVELVAADLAAYRRAVADGHFMRMRRAAYEPGTVDGSAKLERLVEIVDEAAANGHKVVVFSFFLDVLDTVAAVLDGRAMGPLTGSVRPTERQALIDAFTARPDPAVLVSQIEAGGVGLNIQAASVVILTEPQWKPSTESQAIARCHRMGQIRPVEVHRLLAEASVDERMRAVLAGKTQLFDEYARPSELKDSSPDAVDISDRRAVERVASQTDLEREIIEAEQQRLGVGGGAGGS